MRARTLRTIGATAVLIGIAVIALAQIGSDGGSPAEIAVPVASTEPAGDDTIPVEQQFQYRIGLLAGVSTANFWQYLGERPTAWNAYVLAPTKPSLYGIDPATNLLTPDLAAGTQPPTPGEQGGKWIVDVELGQSHTWSDGAPITAEDVVYTFETVRRLELDGGWAKAFPAEIEKIVARSATELRITFIEEPSLATWPHGVGLAPIMPSHVWAAPSKGAENSHELYQLGGSIDVSGGPLQITSRTDDRIEATANPGHPDPSVGSVAYLVFEDESEAVAVLDSGEIDTILDPNGLSKESLGSLAQADDVSIERSPANSVRYLGFNLTRAPMADPAFRRGLALLVDRETATRSLLPDAEAAYTMISPANSTWFDDGEAAAIAAAYGDELEVRLDGALGALGEAGYQWDTPPQVVDGVVGAGTGLSIGGRPPAPLTILTPGDEYDPARQDYTERIEATLEGLGFDVRPVVTDFDTVVDLAFTADANGARQYDMYVLGWTLGDPARPDYYRSLFAADAVANSTGYSDPEFGAHLATYEQATTLDEARSALWAMERDLAEDLPYMVLYHPDIVEVYRSDRVGFGESGVLGGIQRRLGGLDDLEPVS